MEHAVNQIDVSGDDLIEELIDRMDCEELAVRFDAFVTNAVMSDDELDALPDEPTEDDVPGFYVVAKQTTADINGQLEVPGLMISIWAAEQADYADELPAGLDKDRHCRFLTVDDEGLISEMYLLPKRTLH